MKDLTPYALLVRDYDLATGRYIEGDPIGLDGGINTFLYANANPVVFYDATGENPAAVIRAMYAALAACAMNKLCRCKAVSIAYHALQDRGCKGPKCEDYRVDVSVMYIVLALREFHFGMGCDRGSKKIIQDKSRNR